MPASSPVPLFLAAPVVFAAGFALGCGLGHLVVLTIEWAAERLAGRGA